ncbi:YihY/virulence factor BrkB family protein [Patulibacter defluvii]|uniref:YihY/virulence factor BrkB family protein n=1 Tax=Patulibacter defluvii TaxID=3095358 RepID=UPI002A75B307|nr:YihY/virulence factor BrkB family protein [Patulibacter sp. DM4]
MAPSLPRPARRRPPSDQRLPREQWPALARRAFANFREQGMTDWAATLAYYAVLSIVPTLLVAVALTTLLGASSLPERIADEFVNLVKDNASSTSANESAGAIRELVAKALDQAQGGASITLGISILLAINGASGAFAAAGRALNRVHHVSESRGFVRHKLADVATALLVIVLLALAAIGFFVGGGIADSLASDLGLGSVARTVWDVLRFPLAITLLVLALGVVYRMAPDVERQQSLLSPGAATALAVWCLATLGFTVYVQVAGFGSAYGALGGAIVLLFWLWLSSAAFLFGAEVDAELERTLLVRGLGPPAIGGYAAPPAAADGEASA